MGDILGIGTRGLISYQTALSVTAQNIANINTPYYARRVVNFTEAAFNNGVDISSVSRVFEQALSNNLLDANMNYNCADITYQQLLQTESTLDTQSNSVNTYISQALTALNSLNANPAVIGNRTGYLNSLTTLSNRINAISSQMRQQQITQNSGIQGDIQKSNSILQQIGKLNALISAGRGQDVNSLLDQRETQVQELTKYINFTAKTDNENNLNITFGNGIALVFGQNVNQFVTIPDPANAENIAIAMKPIGSQPAIPITNFFTGGSVGGYLQVRDGALAQSQRSLNRLALAFQDQMNKQNKLGIDLNANIGGNIFTDMNSTQAMADRSIPNLNNTGTGGITVHIDNPDQIDIYNYKLRFSSSSDYTLTRTVNGVDIPVTSGTISSYPAQVSADGFTMNLTSGFAADDEFIIAPARNAAASMKVTMTNPYLLALGMPVVASPIGTTSGSIDVTAITDTTTSAFATPKALSPPLRVEFNDPPTTYNLVNADDGTLFESNINYDPTDGNIFPTPGGYDPGYRVVLSGDMAANDQFNIAYNLNGASDNRNGLIMAKMYSQQTVGGDSLNYTSAYTLLSTELSTAVSNANTSFQGYTAVQQQAKEQYNAVSGVSLPEEVANTQRYLQSYQASAQVLQVARQVFDTILSLGR